ncbi:unnamed protein product [Linum tenue]|uniref:Ornithine cyclodeaminase n=1 Tax=Linum tenue TaxID=586396 RepID=A0AAV0IZS1_9ROSI|nr:unnamed protein product [Linum tenue]
MASTPAPASSPIFIDAESLRATLSHSSLIQHFQTSLPAVAATLHTPIRQSYAVSPTSNLLLMPSWSTSPSSSLPYIGVKLVTHFPQNSHLHSLPGIHASYVLFSSATGQTLATMDGTLLTLYRTSCVSGLASKLLARADSRVLVMVGAGALAPHLIRAHLAARPGLREVIIWNRTQSKAAELAEKLNYELGGGGGGVSCRSGGEDLDEVIGLGDIVSCATNNADAAPLVKGGKLKRGAHLDLVGSFKENMRECDDAALRRAGAVFADNEAALVEAGELVGGFERGVIGKGEVGLLVELIKGERAGRKDCDEITVFKSVGSAVVDMLAAQFAYEARARK